MVTKKTTLQTDYKAYLAQLEEFLQLYLVKKAPALPENAKEFIVKIAPWLTLILLLISLPAILFVFGLGSIFLPFSYLGGIGSGFNYTLGMIVLAISLVLEAMAIPGLFNRTKRA
jgi:ATP-dependent protease HslVU (ClpYQ) peptidase subunit